MSYHYQRKKYNKKLIYSILILALILSAMYFILPTYVFRKSLSTTGYIPMKVSSISLSNNAYVQLKNGCYELSIIISPWQAESIREGLEDATTYRPSTHDILSDILYSFNIDPLLVKITKLQDNTYFAQLYLQSWNHLSIVDIRPSDAIAIAVRTNTPIYVNENLVEKTC